MDLDRDNDRCSRCSRCSRSVGPRSQELFVWSAGCVAETIDSSPGPVLYGGGVSPSDSHVCCSGSDPVAPVPPLFRAPAPSISKNRLRSSISRSLLCICTCVRDTDRDSISYTIFIAVSLSVGPSWARLRACMDSSRWDTSSRAAEEAWRSRANANWACSLVSTTAEKASSAAAKSAAPSSLHGLLPGLFKDSAVSASFGTARGRMLADVMDW
mmetsp:Transcript_31979/g.70024  ORF Transcript_31979/g.70024 Transcript_31979/m.70024 type:complete len:213 (-) Transcript_31979:711-1349(-)